MEASNVQKMRDALVDIRDKINKWYDDDYISHGAFSVLWDLCSSALSAPPRNCDVGTPDEQAERFGKLCGKYYNEEEPCNEKCPLASLPITHGFPRCQAYWAQTPYTAEEGGAS